MRNTTIKLIFALLGFAALLSAADPFVGTWKMNAAKTKYKSGTPPKEQTVTITESGADLNIKVSGTAADGSKIAVSYSVPTAGGKGKITESTTAYDGVSGKMVGTNGRTMSYMKGGKEVYATDSKLSADGKSLTVNVKGLNPAGMNVEGTVVYDKQ